MVYYNSPVYFIVRVKHSGNYVLYVYKEGALNTQLAYDCAMS